jgi:membrane protein
MSVDDRAGGRLPGSEAERPQQIPARGWWQVIRRAWKEAKSDNVPLLAGGVAFFGFLALFPALIAAASVYGIAASPKGIATQIDKLGSSVPSDVRGLLTGRLDELANSSNSALTIGLAISIAVAIWSASGGAMNLIKAINVAYDEDETRGFFKLRGTALALTFGGIVFFLLTIALIAVAPPVLQSLHLGIVGTVIAQVVRWALLLLLVIGGLAIAYRVAPDRDSPKMRWASPGAIVATVLWLAGSVAFSFYVSKFGSYNKTYGALAAVAVLMLWLYLTAYAVLLGAEINAEAEHQTARDTTVGPERPMGERDAYVADTYPDEDRDRTADQADQADDGRGAHRVRSEGTRSR